MQLVEHVEERFLAGEAGCRRPRVLEREASGDDAELPRQVGGGTGPQPAGAGRPNTAFQARALDQFVRHP